ncbi:MAG: hypothetical protein NXI31_07935 [bacterium]|nr:hypothetical protein [bacterium]
MKAFFPFVLTAVLSVVGEARAQTFELRNGEVLIGQVVEIGDDEVTLRTGPNDATRKVARDEFAPRSYYAIRARRSDPDSAAHRERLAKLALELGLPLHAVAEWHEVARLVPERAREAQTMVEHIEAEIAVGLLAQARAQIAAGDFGKAKLNAEVILARYGKTSAARSARTVAAEAQAKLEKRGARKPIGATKLGKILDAVQRRETAVAKLGIEPTSNPNQTSRERNRRKKAIKLLEGAWSELDRFTPAAAVKAATANEFRAARERVRGQLGEHYLGMGSILVQRLALPSAEEFNAKACELDPASGGCKQLQGLIVRARIARGFGY